MENCFWHWTSDFILDWTRMNTCYFCRGEAMYPSVDDVTYGGQGKVPEAAVDRMVADLEKQ